jgi:hypothetical protein
MTAMTAAAPALTIAALMRMPGEELEALYRRSEAGPIPDGESDGLASTKPGTALGALTRAIYGTAWQGKVFDAKAGRLVNKVLGLIRMCPAKVFTAESWLDGNPSVIIDYMGVSLLCRPVRDEIRRVAPNVYLGIAYVRTPGRPVAPLWFALDFSRSSSV